ncbi:MAG: beta-N-acetylhexosaminidase [Bacteroidota bacterium]|nr:beta-N-acetylhexosaminidase [Bacteroidota bacterium]
MKATYSVKILFVIMLCLGYCLNFNRVTAQNTSASAIIPIPASINTEKGEFTLTSKTKIVVSDNNLATIETAKYLADQAKILCGLNLSIVTTSKSVKNSIVLNTKASGKKESYHLKVGKKNIVISGADQSGLFYGVQTLLQMISSAAENSPKIVIACADINDEPSFTWRGMHLDVSRHFFPVEFVKKMIDMLAMYKINTFHWHLTDDQGWRIEIKKYPKLTEIGGWRDKTMIGHYTENDQKFDSTRYGGFYTQEQIKDVVTYAQKRYITVVPEIEMPGHAVAALSAYPQFSCTGGSFKTYTKWGVSDDVYCAGKEETFSFLEDILDEVVALFPGQYIHIGGDECPKTRWKACPACQKRIKDEGLKNELELQSYFVKRIEKFIVSKGKKLIGWDEILEGGLPERAAVMSWRGYEGGVEAAHTGHDVVMTPGGYCYFDHYQSQDQTNEPLAFGGFLPLEKVYSFSPVPPELSAEEAKHILGAQANVWTEYIPTEKQAEYMIFPRICAMSEILWSPKAKQDYTQFLSRLNGNLKRLQKAGINYRPLKTN